MGELTGKGLVSVVTENVFGSNFSVPFSVRVECCIENFGHQHIGSAFGVAPVVAFERWSFIAFDVHADEKRPSVEVPFTDLFH